MDAKHFPILIEKDKLPEDALKIIKNVKQDWKLEDVKFKIFTDGITNKLIGCYQINEPKHLVLIRVYGDKTDLYIDRAVEIKNFKLMNSKGYAPELFATFENGMVYQYIPGEVLNIQSCYDEAVYPLVASMLAKMHKLRYNDVALAPILWDKCECFINLVSDTYCSPDQQLSYNNHFSGGKSVFRAELKQLRNWLEKINNPIVFCHNDLLLANVIHMNNSVWFIDYEYAGYNYQAFDIANHFAEFAGVAEYDSSLYPSEEFRLEWIRAYLREYSENGAWLDEERVKKLHDDVCKFTPMAHFFWALWALVQAKQSSIDFDYFNYAVNRYNEYKKFLKPDY